MTARVTAHGGIDAEPGGTVMGGTWGSEDGLCHLSPWPSATWSSFIRMTRERVLGWLNPLGVPGGALGFGSNLTSGW